MGRGKSGRNVLLGNNQRKVGSPLFLDTDFLNLDPGETPGYWDSFLASINTEKFEALEAAKIAGFSETREMFDSFIPGPGAYVYWKANPDIFYEYFVLSIKDFVSEGRPVFFDQPMIADAFPDGREIPPLAPGILTEYLEQMLFSKSDFPKFFEQLIPSFSALERKGIPNCGRDPIINNLVRSFYSTPSNSLFSYYGEVRRPLEHYKAAFGAVMLENKETEFNRLEESHVSKYLAQKEITHLSLRTALKEAKLTPEVADKEYLRARKELIVYMFAASMTRYNSQDVEKIIDYELKEKGREPSFLFKRLNTVIRRDDYLRSIEENRDAINYLDTREIIAILGDAADMFVQENTYGAPTMQSSIDRIILEFNKLTQRS